MNNRTTQENNNWDRNRQKHYVRMILFLHACTILGLYNLLPRLLSSASKAKESQARNNIGAVVRDRQEYFLENTSFSRRLASRKTSFKSETDNYSYRILFPSFPTVAKIKEAEKVDAIAIAAYPKVQKPKYAAPKKVFFAVVWMASNPFTRESNIRSAVCESEGSFEELQAEGENEFWFLNFAYPSQKNVKFSCPEGFENL